MTITTDSSRVRSAALRLSPPPTVKQSALASRAQSGFTLIEIIVASSIATILIGSMLATFLAFASSIQRVEAHSDINAQSRFLLEQFARDVRVAEDITTATATSIVLELPAGSPYNENEVEYTYDAGLEIFSRIERDSGGTELDKQILLDGVAQFVFTYFDPLGDALALSTDSLMLSIKSLRVEAEIAREVLDDGVNDYILSARLMLRNRPTTQ